MRLRNKHRMPCPSQRPSLIRAVETAPTDSKTRPSPGSDRARAAGRFQPRAPQAAPASCASRASPAACAGAFASVAAFSTARRPSGTRPISGKSVNWPIPSSAAGFSATILPRNAASSLRVNPWVNTPCEWQRGRVTTWEGEGAWLACAWGGSRTAARARASHGPAPMYRTSPGQGQRLNGTLSSISL